MKLLVVIVLSAFAVAVQCEFSKDEAMEAFRVVSKICMEETGATDADLETIIKHEPTVNMAAKCLGACIMKKFEVMDSNGKFVKDVGMKIAALHTQGDKAKLKLAEEIIDICKDVPVSDNPCEAAEQYALCMKAEAVKRGIQKEDF